MTVYNRRAQHEIVGFVIIVVVVAVIGLIFLSFMIGRGDVSNATSVEIEDLLGALMIRTSDCAINFVPQYLDVERLVKKCYENPIDKCLNGKNVCDVLDEELKGVGRILGVGSSGINQGFKINVVYRDLEFEDSGSEVIPSIIKGDIDSCEVRIGASRYVDVSFGSGIVDVGLEVCRG